MFWSPGASSKAKAISQDLRGKHFVITGANTGLGYICSRELAKMGAKVTMACRSAEKGQEAIERLRQEAMAKPVAEVRFFFCLYIVIIVCLCMDENKM